MQLLASEIAVPSWTGTPLNWRGVIKVGRETVWTCQHGHRDRNHSSCGASAWHCAAEALRVARMPVDEAMAYAKRNPRSTAIAARASVRNMLGLDDALKD